MTMNNVTVEIIFKAFPILNFAKEVGIDTYLNNHPEQLITFGTEVRNLLIDNGYVNSFSHEVMGNFLEEKDKDISIYLQYWHDSHKHQDIKIFAYDVLYYIIDNYGKTQFYKTKWS